MIYALKNKTPPASEPITLDEAKEHLRVDGPEEDLIISSLVKAAREWCESFSGRSYVTQTWEIVLDDFPAEDYIKLSRPPLQSVTSIKYYGTDNTEYTMTATDYFVDIKSEPGRVALAYGESWPSTTLRPINGVIITYDAGYGDSTLVPDKIKAAIKLVLGHLYVHREEVTEKVLVKVPTAAESLLWQDRIVQF
jgi:uncharacterized phiE125 gp8 family phage protein